MATELSIALRIRAFLDQAKTAVREFDRDVDRLGKTGQQAGREVGDIAAARASAGLRRTTDDARRTREELARLSGSVRTITSLWLGFQAARGLGNTAAAIFAVSDQAQQLRSRMQLATASVEELRAAEDGLYRQSNELQVPLAASVSLFARLNPVIKELNGSYQDTLRINYGLAAALKVSGATAEESASTILQFSQALGSGRLAGEEFRALAEASPRLMKIIADALGVPRGALKQMASEGKLTAAVIGNALLGSFDRMKSEVASFGPTVSGSMTQLSNAYLKWTQDSENANATARATANVLRAIAENFDTAATIVITGATTLAGVITSRAIGALTAYIAVQVQDRAAKLAEAQAALAAAQAENTLAAARLRATQAGGAAYAGTAALASAERQAAASAAAVAVAQGRVAALSVGVGTALRGILGLLGGPVGLIVTLGMAGAAWLAFGRDAKTGVESAADQLKRLREEKEKLNNNGRIKELTDEIVRYGAQISEWQKKQEYVVPGSIQDQDINKRITALREEQRVRAELIAELTPQSLDTAPPAGELRDDPATQLNKLRAELNTRVQIELEYQEKVKQIRSAFKAALDAEQDPQRRAALAQEESDALVLVAEKRASALAGLAKPAFDRAKADAQRAKAELDASFTLLQDSISRGNAVIDQALNDGNISIDAAYQARLESLRTQTAAQRQVLEAERDELERALAAATKPEDRAGIEANLLRVNAQIKLLQPSLDEATRQLGIWKSEQERELATITARIRVDVASLTGQFDRAAVEEQLRLQYESEYKRIGNLDNPDEQARQRDRLDMLVRAGTAQAEMNAKLEEAQRLQRELAIAEESIRIEQESGQISQIEAEGRIKAAREAQLPLLRSIVEQMRAIRDALPPEAAAAVEQATAAIGEMENQVRAATPVTEDLGKQVRNGLIDNFADAAASAVAHGQSLRKAIGNTLREIAADIVRSGIKEALVSVFKPDGADAGGGFFGAVFGGIKSLFGFKEGGLIRGPGTGTSDSIPALVDGQRPIAVSDEEFIQPQRAVKHYGLGFMEAIRTLKFPKPRFAFGGLVRAHEQARYATGGQARGATSAGGLNVSVSLINQGTPQRVVEQQQRVDGRDMIVSLVLEDLQRGGPISRALPGVLSRGQS